MPNQCQSLAIDVRQLIETVPPLDIPIRIREMLKRELLGCERVLGQAETNELIADLFPPQPPPR